MRLKSMLCSGLLAAFIIIGTAFTPAKSFTVNKFGWFFLADKKVGFGSDHDVINFGNWGDDVRQVKLKVTDGPLKMYRMSIHFDNGSTQEVQLRNFFAQGSESRVIDLDGGLRHLTSIDFWYETKGYAKGKARLAVWGYN